MRGVRKNAKRLALARLKRRYTVMRHVGRPNSTEPDAHIVWLKVEHQSFQVTPVQTESRKEAQFFRRMLSEALWKVIEKEAFEKRRAQCRRYGAIHRPEIIARKRKYYQTHRVRLIAEWKAWSKANPEKRKAQRARWRAKHPELRKFLNQRSEHKAIATLSDRYIKHLIHQQRSGDTHQEKREQIRLWRTKPQFKLMATASRLQSCS